jgi:3-phosphoshikimate 1-carboxyvinyltransferase
MAYAAAGAENVDIHVRDLKSKPYIDLTLKVLRDFGWEVKNNHYESFHFGTAVNALLPDRDYTVEGDWSGAAFLLVAGAISGEIEVSGLDVYSTQADKAVIQALQDAQASLSIQENRINIGPARLRAFHFDANECPDLFPPLVALASCCEGKSVIAGVNRLTHKESNRALTLQEEFGRMGVQIVLQDDLMIIEGTESIKSARVHSHHDHRIAMACAIAALRADGPVIIEDAEAINKSYPEFYSHLKKLGVKVE